MDTKRVKRKISAILSADVAGYGRLMGDDEAATVQTLESHRETISSIIQEYGGHVVDSPGDNILSEFASVVDAVQCAVEIQQVIKAKDADLPTDRRMAFRIGINLGDVIEEGERIYGDGVNIAARIEALADPGGICISGSAYEQIESKLALGYVDIGDHTLKNISRQIRVYRIPTEPEGDEETGSPAVAAVDRSSRLDDALSDRLARGRSKEIEGYYIGGVVCLAVSLGLPILGYFVGRIGPGAFWPIVGVAPLVGLVGISLVLVGKLMDRRTRGANSEDPR